MSFVEALLFTYVISSWRRDTRFSNEFFERLCDTRFCPFRDDRKNAVVFPDQEILGRGS